jgi:hypothetical protein
MMMMLAVGTMTCTSKKVVLEIFASERVEICQQRFHCMIKIINFLSLSISLSWLRAMCQTCSKVLF